MLVPGSANPLLLRTVAAPAAGGISRSIRLNAPDSAYLSRTPASAGNRKTWTWAGWVKRSAFANQFLFRGGTTTNDTQYLAIDFTSNHELRLSSATTNYLITTQVFRDASAWYHIVFAFDVTQGTNANKAKFYVNGTEITTFSTDARGSLSNQDYGVNQTQAHVIGGEPISSNRYLDGYLADIYFIDGQALTPSSFTETDATTGQLIPKAYTGSYGTNGFHLEFADNSSNTATTLGKDTSGNGNNWTPNNLSVTAGAGNDSVIDVPTTSGTDSGLGGEVRGNYCCLNAVLPYTNVTLSNGNLDFVSGATYRNAVGTIGASSGKWYWEVLVNSWSSDAGVGITNNPANVITGYLGSNSSGWAYSPYPIGSNGSKYGNGAAVGYGATYTNGDIIGVALDVDNGTLTFYKNGVSQGTAFTGLAAGTYFPALGGGSSTSMTVNTGQRPFAYQNPGTNRPSADFKALCSSNLPAPLVTKPSTVMDVKLYTGTGATQNITGLAFSPDLVWAKVRNTTGNHSLYDIVRGATKRLASSTTSAEATFTNSLTSFDSGGFSLGSNPDGDVNASGNTYVAWAWDAGTTTTTNTVGSISSQVRANATAGFSIVSYTGTGSAATVGHGLGVKPAFAIFKDRNSGTRNFICYHSALGAGKFLKLNSTDAEATSSIMFNNTEPTSTVFSLANNSETNSTNNMICWAFAPVVGYSSFGSYTGNGSSDGPFVYTGFRPRFILWKPSSATGNWNILDTSRDPYNLSGNSLQPNLSNAEFAGSVGDFLSNGFKVRDSSTAVNGSGTTYVFAAFAESPFNYARAR